jgi:hypothetical protein
MQTEVFMRTLNTRIALMWRNWTVYRCNWSCWCNQVVGKRYECRIGWSCMWDVLDAIDVITQPLCNLFNFVYDNGVYPVAWSNCIVVPVPKKSDTTEAGNYRGIAITSNLGKIFSIVLNSRLLKWAENTNILCNNQFGFRKNRSTVDCIFILQAIISRTLSSKDKLYCAFLKSTKAQ